MEIMGLALVVILISLGILFAVKFSAMKPATSGARKTYIKTIKASNMLNTLLKVNTGCAAGATVTQLIQDCAETIPKIDCGGIDSCTYVGDTIRYIFNNTLVKWGNQSFYFKIVKGQSTNIMYLGAECPGIKESKNQPIPVTGNLVTVTLDLCG